MGISNNLGNTISRRLLIILLAAAFILRIVCILINPPTSEKILTRLNDSTDYDYLAQSILKGGYCSPSGEPTAFRPPIYPAFLALVYLFLGKQNLIATAIIQAILGTLNCLLIMKLGEKITGSKAVSWISVLIAGFYPAFILQTCQILTEVLGRFLWLGALNILMESSCLHNRKGLILGGIIFSLAVLTKSVLLIVLPILTIWVLFKINASLVNRIKSSMICFLLPVLILVGSWTLRNYQISGKPVPVSTNFPITFAQGVTPYSYYTKKWYISEELLSVPDNFLELTQMRFYKGIHEELEIGEYYSNLARNFIKKRSGFFLRLSIKKFLHFWSPFISNAPLERWIAFLSMAPVLFLGWLGILISLVKRDSARSYTFLILALSLSICLPYIISQPDIRYRVGFIDPFWIIYSSLALVFAFQKVLLPLPCGSSDQSQGEADDG